MKSEFLEGTDKDGELIRLVPNGDGSYTEYRPNLDAFNNVYWVSVGVWDTFNEIGGQFTWHEVNLK